MHVNTHFGLFHGLNVGGLFLVSFLFVMYRLARMNLLVRSAAGICALMAVLLAAGLVVPYAHFQSDIFCSVQAVMLNYAHVSLHAHFCFLMMANLFGAKGWKLFGIRDVRKLTGLMVVLSLALPLVSLILVISFLTVQVGGPGEGVHLFGDVVERKAFFCTVNEPAWLAYRAWFIAFSGPGITCATILFVEMWRSRQSILELKSTTQFGLLRLMHLFLAILIYLALAVGSVWVGLSPVVDLKVGPRRVTQLFLTRLCERDLMRNAEWSEYRRILCPSVTTYLPVCAGWALFIIYGFGSAAFRFYRMCWMRVFGAGKDTATDKRHDSLDSVNAPRKTSVRRTSSLSVVDDEIFLDQMMPRPQSQPTENPVRRKGMMRRGSEPNNKKKKKHVDRGIGTVENIPEEDDDDDDNENLH